MTVRIVTDSTCDLPPDYIAENNIEVIPLYVNIGERTLKDGVDITKDEFFRDIGSYETHPATSAPPVGEFAEIYQRIHDEGATEVVSIHVAGDLSATLNSAQLGADMVDDLTVHFVDSKTATLGVGLQVMKAVGMLKAGESAEAIQKAIQAVADKTKVFAGFDTLEYLQKGGRISWGQASIGSLLNIKPILSIQNGAAEPNSRVRTYKKITPKLISILESLGELEALAVIHSDETRGKALLAALEDYFPDDNRIFMGITPVLGVHAGPGAVGFACIQK